MDKKKRILRIILIALAVVTVFVAGKLTPSLAAPGENVTVTFDSQGATAVDAQTFPKNGTATEPTGPEKTGYDFVEWRKEGDATAWDFSTPVTADMTLVAVYEGWNIKVFASAYRPADNDYLAHAEMTVTYSNPPPDSYSQTTMANGFIRFDVPYGQVVTVEETKVPDGFFLGGPGPYSLRINDEGKLEEKNLGDGSGQWEESDGDVYFYHYKKHPILVSKSGEQDPETLLEEAELEILGPAMDSVFKATSGTPEFENVIMITEGMAYTLRENIVPPGYVKCADVVFQVDHEGQIKIISGEANVQNKASGYNLPPRITLVNKRESPPSDTYQVQVISERRLTGEALAGAKIEYYDKDDLSTVVEFTTIAGANSIDLEQGKVYRFIQKTDPPGYRLWGVSIFECMMDDLGRFFVRPDGDVNPWEEMDSRRLAFLNHRELPIILSKVAEDAPDVEQAGATLQFGWPGYPDYLVKASGAPEFPKTVVISEGICYTYSEVTAPDGYEKHEDIVFFVDKEGKVVIESGEALVVEGKDENPHTIVMVNKKVSKPPDSGDTPGSGDTTGSGSTPKPDDKTPKETLPDTGDDTLLFAWMGSSVLLLGASVLLDRRLRLRASKNH